MPDAKIDQPLIPYSTDVARGAGRTPIGIILFAVSHLLLGGLLLVMGGMLFKEASLRGGFDAEMVAAIVVLAVAIPMTAGGVTLLLKGKRAWIACITSHVILALAESILAAWGVATATMQADRWDRPGVISGLVTAAIALSLMALCLVVLGYLAKPKARICFGLTPGQTREWVRWLPLALIVAALFVVSAGVIIGSTMRR